MAAPRLFERPPIATTERWLGGLGGATPHGSSHPWPHPELIVSVPGISVPAISALTDGDDVTDHAINKGSAVCGLAVRR
jgi:hypothetical protein